MAPVLLAVSIWLSTLTTSDPTSLKNILPPNTTLVASAKSLQNDGRVLGHLGQASMSAKIYSARDIGSAVYYDVRTHQYLVVLADEKDGSWIRVLLQNGQYGFMQKDSINVLPYQVISTLTQTEDGKHLPSKPRAADMALSKVGIKLGKGTDSAKFVRDVFRKAGISLPATAEAQASVGQPITRMEALKKGDRVFFWGDKAQKIDQTGIYLGNGYFLMPDKQSGLIETHYLGDKKWLKMLVASRR